jgi:hypothetical protein
MVDLNAYDIGQASKMVEGTARSMGIVVEDKDGGIGDHVIVDPGADVGDQESADQELETQG